MAAAKRQPKKPTVETAANGRSPNGRFGPGNRFAKGNPFAKQAAEIRASLITALTPRARQRIANALVKKAEDGDMVAIKEIYDRVLGRTTTSDQSDRLEAIEARLFGALQQ